MAGATAALVPPPASLLLHAGVSWWSSLQRCAVLRRDIVWAAVLRFALPSLPAIWVSLLLGSRLSAPAWRLVLAGYLVAWALSAKVRSALSRRRSAMIAAVFAGVFSALVGVGGVVVMPTIRSSTGTLDQAIATEAAITVLQNTLKISLLLLVLHVSLAQHTQHLVVMAFSASAGLVMGRSISLTLSTLFKERLLKSTLLLVAVWLSVSALL